MIALVVTIAVMNLCLGYALAVWAGYGPPTLSAGYWAAVGRAEMNQSQVPPQ